MNRKLIFGFGLGAVVMGAVWAATAFGPARAQGPDRKAATMDTAVGLVAAVRAPAGFRLEMSYSVQDSSTARSDTVNVSAIEFYPNYVVYHYEGGGGALPREKLWSLRWQLKEVPRPAVGTTTTTPPSTVEVPDMPADRTTTAEKKTTAPEKK